MKPRISAIFTSLLSEVARCGMLAPPDRAHRGVGFQRRCVDADGLALQIRARATWSICERWRRRLALAALGDRVEPSFPLLDIMRGKDPALYGALHVH